MTVPNPIQAAARQKLLLSFAELAKERGAPVNLAQVKVVGSKDRPVNVSPSSLGDRNVKFTYLPSGFQLVQTLAEDDEVTWLLGGLNQAALTLNVTDMPMQVTLLGRSSGSGPCRVRVSIRAVPGAYECRPKTPKATPVTDTLFS